MKAPGVQTGRDTLSIPAPLGFRHYDGTPITLEDCVTWVARLSKENTERAQIMKDMAAQGRACNAHEYAELVKEARHGTLAIRVWSALEVLARDAVNL
ncbi:hypothetical protein [Deinococcus sp.]|uniref:hypothetical protein n=1 Tax=Deinococcus sp. TaxID=47478 RepID=UPI003B592CC5